ncbi:hypothetical protein B0T24DRAFT_669104 [Lasiosphaeria ovina]|uniref:Uncharacterized protein n=1 Tax=Lasiosphaeria ovina TaxID=92902 RepID=A0AAE0K5E4_9PEZI|nr:hypothetical protein B0T24DRAFT_669104 [Lasiosphaeria ovina]
MAGYNWITKRRRRNTPIYLADLPDSQYYGNVIVPLAGSSSPFWTFLLESRMHEVCCVRTVIDAFVRRHSHPADDEVIKADYLTIAGICLGVHIMHRTDCTMAMAKADPAAIDLPALAVTTGALNCQSWNRCQYRCLTRSRSRARSRTRSRFHFQSQSRLHLHSPSHFHFQDLSHFHCKRTLDPAVGLGVRRHACAQVLDCGNHAQADVKAAGRNIIVHNQTLDLARLAALAIVVAVNTAGLLGTVFNQGLGA